MQYGKITIGIQFFLIVLLLFFVNPIIFAVASCQISSAGVDFGIYDPENTVPLDANGNISITCSDSIPGIVFYRIRISAGQSGDSSNRYMLSQYNDKLIYNLYTNASRTNIWRDDSLIFGICVIFSGGSCNRNYTIYGRTFANQFNVGVGDYSDTITATIYY